MTIIIATASNKYALNTSKVDDLELRAVLEATAKGIKGELMLEDFVTVFEAEYPELVAYVTSKLNPTEEVTNTSKEDTMTKEAPTPTIRVTFMHKSLVITSTRLQELGMDQASNLKLMGKDLSLAEFSAKANKDLVTLIIERFDTLLTSDVKKAVRAKPETAGKWVDIPESKADVTKIFREAVYMAPERKVAESIAFLQRISFDPKVSNNTLGHMLVWENAANNRVRYVAFEKEFYVDNTDKCQKFYNAIKVAVEGAGGRWQKRMTYLSIEF